MLLACLPFGPVVTSNETFWPSFSVLNPGMLIAEKCANRSSPPPSGVMNPKPFASLNHLTVPVAIVLLPYEMKGMWVFGQQGLPGARTAPRHRRTGSDKAWKPNIGFVRASPHGRQAGGPRFSFYL